MWIKTQKTRLAEQLRGPLLLNSVHPELLFRHIYKKMYSYSILGKCFILLDSVKKSTKTNININNSWTDNDAYFHFDYINELL
jgi:deoxyadenosine/deoxycytidine kinase